MATVMSDESPASSQATQHPVDPGSSSAPSASRSRFALSVLLGVSVTVITAALMVLGSLSPIERVTLDWRFRIFDSHNPPPSSRIIHVDIDDQATATVGRWPWPRARLADVVDELDRAGASVIAFDVLFPEAQPQRIERRAEATGDSPAVYDTFDDDKILADSIKRSGKVVLAVSLAQGPAGTPLAERIKPLLESDLTIQAKAAIDQLGLTPSEAAALNTEWSAHKSTIMRRRIHAMCDASPDAPPTLADCRAALLPKLDALVTDASELSLLATEYARVRSVRLLSQRLRPVEPPIDRFTYGAEPGVPIPVLADAAMSAGSVTFEHDADGVARTVPIFMHDGRVAYPHLSLLIACRLMDVELADVRVTEHAVTLPDAQIDATTRRDVTVPLMIRRAGDGWRSDAGHALVCWPTANPWQTLYDPAGVSTRQHVPIGRLIELADARRAVPKNQRAADNVLLNIMSDPALGYGESQIVAYGELVDAIDGAPTAVLIEKRDKTRADVLDNLAFFVEGFLDASASDEDKAVGRKIQTAIRNHNRAIAEAVNGEKTIADETERLRALLQDSVAIIGWTATGSIADFVPTSLEAKAPGPVVHGAMLNAMLTDHFIERAPIWVDVCVVLAIGIGITLLAASLSPIAALGATLVAVFGGLLFNGYVLFDVMNVWAVAAAPAIAGGASWASVTVYRLIIEQRQRLAITRQFKNYIDPSLVELLVADPTRIVMGECELTCMFSDIAGFTTISETLGTDRTASLLNKYLAKATDALMAHRGTVNKYLGDGIMAFWGAPVANETHAMDTCIGVLATVAAVRELNKDPELHDCPTLVVRTGIATGPMMVGDFGAPPRRSDYTVIGDTVNFSARLESANKQFDTGVMVSHRTKELIDGAMLTRPVGRLVVVGKSQPESVYELLNTRDAATDEQRDLAAATTEAVDAYYAADFAACRERFESLADRFGRTKLVERYLDACAAHLEANTAAENFDGTLVLTQK